MMSDEAAPRARGENKLSARERKEQAKKKGDDE